MHMLPRMMLGVDKNALAKRYMPMNVLFMGMFLHASFLMDITGPGKNAVGTEQNACVSYTPRTSLPPLLPIF